MVKQSWNSEHYAQIKVSVRPEIATAFKSACEVAGVSMAGTLSSFMAGYASAPSKKTAMQVLTKTRRQRRNAVKSLLACLAQIRDSEESYRDNIPENLQGGSAYDTADECASILSEAIELLESAYQ
jgi:pyruvate/oxaloacetate carboxyltransferase